MENNLIGNVYIVKSTIMLDFGYDAGLLLCIKPNAHSKVIVFLFFDYNDRFETLYQFGLGLITILNRNFR